MAKKEPGNSEDPNPIKDFYENLTLGQVLTLLNSIRKILRPLCDGHPLGKSAPVRGLFGLMGALCGFLFIFVLHGLVLQSFPVIVGFFLTFAYVATFGLLFFAIVVGAVIWHDQQKSYCLCCIAGIEWILIFYILLQVIRTVVP